jgi:hypothetical protein
VVPKRAFRDEATAQAFADLAERYRSEARLPPASVREPVADVIPVDAPPRQEFFEKPSGVQGPSGA